MSVLNRIFNLNKAIIGMVHLKPLPGSCNFDGDMENIYTNALEDALALEKGGVQGLIIENDGDQPYSINLDLSQTAGLAAIASYIKSKISIPIGISAAFNDYKSALACAKAAQCDFVRIPVFVDTVVCYNGIIEPCCYNAMKYRKQIQAENIAIMADIQVKHTHMLCDKITIEESAKTAESCGADIIIVTGVSTGSVTPIEIIEKVKNVVSIPVFVGSGTNINNSASQIKIADGAIVGTSFKTNGKIDNQKVISLMNATKLFNNSKGI